MKLLSLVVPILSLRLVRAYLVSPPGAAAPGSDSDCSEWVQQSYSLTCAIIEEFYGLTEAEFEAWNPSTLDFGTNCTLIDDLYYCVQINFASMSTLNQAPPTSSIAYSTTSSSTFVTTTTTISSSKSSTSSTKSTTSSSSSSTKSSTSSTKSTTSTSSSKSTTTTSSTKPTTSTSSSKLVTTTTSSTKSITSTSSNKSTTSSSSTKPTTSTSSNKLTTTTTSTSTGDGISTPTPYQTGMASNCDGFHLVVSGDTCAAVASTAGISLTQFYAWNPAVGSSCAYLDVGDYVCVDIIGVTPTTTTSNGVTTPTPIQTGMVTNCDLFHLVVSGDTCSAVVTAAGITLANFYLWNPAVGSSCSYLDVGDYVCIGIL